MGDVPDIVKILREEERLGITHNKLDNVNNVIGQINEDKKKFNDEKLNIDAFKNKGSFSCSAINKFDKGLSWKDRYKILLNNIPHRIFFKDNNSVYVLCNKAYANDLKINPDNIVNHTDFDFFPKELAEKYRDEDKLLIESGKSEEIDEEYEKDGEIYKIHTYKAPVRDRNGNIVGIFGIFWDISKQKKIESELMEAHQVMETIIKQLERKVQQRTDEIQRLLVQKDQFIGQLGHDLKTPLSILLNIIPMISEEIKSPEGKEDCKMAIRNINYINTLVKETLKIAELSSPVVELEKNEISLKSLLEEVLNDNKLLFKVNKIEIENFIDKPLVIMVDKLKIKEVFYNLINNSVKFTPEGGKIRFKEEENDESVKIIIEDTGIGMTQEQSNHIFDDFFKADTARTDLEGSGLGLSICRRIIEKHGGKIWAESDGSGKGSKFFFTLNKGKTEND